jgi:NAD(P)-dependent dehydrogenase (short-subunit alcohol dehydrogenase family)
LHIAPFADTQASDFEKAWCSMVLSAVHLAPAVIPAMVAEGRGILIALGASASLRGGAQFSAFASAKAGWTEYLRPQPAVPCISAQSPPLWPFRKSRRTI